MGTDRADRQQTARRGERQLNDSTRSVAVVRVVPDVAGIVKQFDYTVSCDEPGVRPGTIVRVELHRRRVDGWITAVDPPDAFDRDRLAPVIKVSSAGPTPELMRLAAWAGWRWCYNPVALLRAASAPNRVPPDFETSPTAERASVDSGIDSLFAPTLIDGTTSRNDSSGSVVARAAFDALEALDRATDPANTFPSPWSPKGPFPAFVGANEAEGRSPVWVVDPLEDPTEWIVDRLAEIGGSALVMLPRGRRARSVISALRAAGRRVLSPYEAPAKNRAAFLTEIWKAAAQGQCVVVGGRNAIWLPSPDLASVVLADDADEVWKNQSSPAWHAREVAARRCEMAEIPFAVRSPLPTVEALATASSIAGFSTPFPTWHRIGIVDRRAEPPGSGLLTEEIAAAIRGALDAGLRVVAVFNQKGRARLLACASCSSLTACEVCSGAVTADDAGLVCGACGARRPKVCQVCGAVNLKVLRPGAARLADELASMFRRVPTFLVDASGAQQRLGMGSIAASEQEMAPGERRQRTGRDDAGGAAIFVGTEAVFHRVGWAGLVVFLDADQELSAQRLRAKEQAAWLLVRALRMTAASPLSRRVVISTRDPEHPVLDLARTARVGPLLEEERLLRQLLGANPYGLIARVRAVSKVMNAFLEALEGTSLDVDGPIGPEERPEYLLRGADGEACTQLGRAARAGRQIGTVRLDVDPLRI